jgi:hypothetical protein
MAGAAADPDRAFAAGAEQQAERAERAEDGRQGRPRPPSAKALRFQTAAAAGRADDVDDVDDVDDDDDDDGFAQSIGPGGQSEGRGRGRPGVAVASTATQRSLAASVSAASGLSAQALGYVQRVSGPRGASAIGRAAPAPTMAALSRLGLLDGGAVQQLSRSLPNGVAPGGGGGGGGGGGSDSDSDSDCGSEHSLDSVQRLAKETHDSQADRYKIKQAKWSRLRERQAAVTRRRDQRLLDVAGPVRKLLHAARSSDPHAVEHKMRYFGRTALVQGNEGGRTALQIAVTVAKPALVAALLDNGADPNQADGSGCTALHWAAATVDNKKGEEGGGGGGGGGRKRPLRKGEHGYGVDVVAEGTARSSADALAVTRLLLERGADPHVRNNMGQTPAEWAARWGNAKTARALEKWEVEVSRA